MQLLKASATVPILFFLFGKSFLFIANLCISIKAFADNATILIKIRKHPVADGLALASLYLSPMLNVYYSKKPRLNISKAVRIFLRYRCLLSSISATFSINNHLLQLLPSASSYTIIFFSYLTSIAFSSDALVFLPTLHCIMLRLLTKILIQFMFSVYPSYFWLSTRVGWVIIVKQSNFKFTRWCSNYHLRNAHSYFVFLCYHPIVYLKYSTSMRYTSSS